MYTLNFVQSPPQESVCNREKIILFMYLESKCSIWKYVITEIYSLVVSEACK